MRIIFSFIVVIFSSVIAFVAWPQRDIVGMMISLGLLLMTLSMNLIGRANLSKEKQAEVLILVLGVIGILLGFLRLVFSIESSPDGRWSAVFNAISATGGEELLSLFFIALGAGLIIRYFMEKK